MSAAEAEEPVAILGAGLAGLTAAYRLQQAGVPWILYEASARFGGRAYTKRHFNADGMFCELGGELVDTDHVELRELARELGLPLQSLASTKAGVSRNLYLFQGQIHTDAQLVAAVAPLVERFDADVRSIFGKAERRMITYQDHFNSAAFDKMTLRAYLDSLTGVDRWVRDAVEVAYVTEMGLEADRQSALNLLLLVATKAGPGDFELFGDSDEAFRVVGGSSRLAEALAEKIGARAEGSARYKPGHALVRFSDAGHKLALSFSTPGGTVERSFSRVVCTVPFSVLREVDGIYSLDMSPRKKASLREMAYGTNSKLMLGCADRFWRQGSATRPPANGGVFTDLPSQSYWDTSRLQPGSRGIMTNYTGGKPGESVCAASAGAVRADLETIFPGLSSRFDGAQAVMNWSRYRFNRGSYICPAPGDYARHYGAAGETECGGRLFFAGEHASPDGAGYMNGAVESANVAVRALLTSARTTAAVRVP